MCCFTGLVKSVSSTRIFAREFGAEAPRRQYVVYQMNLDAPRDLAMVLPIPTLKVEDEKASETTVKFINLEGYPEFFAELSRGFPQELLDKSSSLSRGSAPPPAKLEVHQVGSFEASYVPRPVDFARLDERFRISAELWEKVPGYKDFGFAVFKLKRGKQTVHPMAFSFERADVSRLFFPTVHIHDGKVHETANFDHLLYCQPTIRALNILGWDESRGHTGQFASAEKSKNILLAEQHSYRKQISGRKKNVDTYLNVG